MQRFDKKELESAGFEFSRQIERLASERASDNDIHGVYRLVRDSITVQRMTQRIVRFEVRED